VTPEAEEHLDKPHESRIKARGLLEVMHYSDEAARPAYLAGLHRQPSLMSRRAA
jgi:hypothetical protein